MYAGVVGWLSLPQAADRPGFRGGTFSPFFASVSAAATAPLHDSGRVRPGHGAKLPE